MQFARAMSILYLMFSLSVIISAGVLSRRMPWSEHLIVLLYVFTRNEILIVVIHLVSCSFDICGAYISPIY